ncbi:surface-adhesin E family protein [Brevundimonas vesicularis]|uniref:surface-adhesin E family protein n=1 Tax=Brevundimonas vesicularis TaxID=41276 RepID=UPI0038D399A9
MKSLYLGTCLAACIGLSPALAQDAVPQDVPVPDVAVPVAEAAPVAEEWQGFSRNDRQVYLVRLSPLPTTGDVVQVHIARVPSQNAASDLSYKLDEYELRCAANQSRLVAESEYDAAGNLIERYPDDSAEWEAIRSTSLSAYFKPIVCDGARAQGKVAASVRAFIERGRK